MQQNLIRFVFARCIKAVIVLISGLAVFNAEIDNAVVNDFAARKRSHAVSIACLHVYQPVIVKFRIFPVINAGLRTFAFGSQHTVRYAAGSRLVDNADCPAGFTASPVIDTVRIAVCQFSAMHGKHTRCHVRPRRHGRRSQIYLNIAPV